MPNESRNPRLNPPGVLRNSQYLYDDLPDSFPRRVKTNQYAAIPEWYYDELEYIKGVATTPRRTAQYKIRMLPDSTFKLAWEYSPTPRHLNKSSEARTSTLSGEREFGSPHNINFSNSTSETREPDLMSGTLHSQHETLEREHYPKCSQLVYDDANEFNDFVAEYLKSQFSIDEPSRDLQYVWRDAYLDLYDGSIAPEMLSEDFWTLVEAWDSIRVNSRDATRPKAVPAPRVKQEASTISKSSAEDQDTPTLPETPKEHITECSTSIHGLAGLQAQTPSLPGKTWEERRTCNSVVSIHVKGEDIPSPDASAAYKPSDPIPVSSPIPISPATPKPCPSTLSNKHDSPRVIREVRRKRDSTLESRNASERVQMTRSQTRLSSLKTSSLSTPREPHRNRRSSLAKDNELSKAHNNGFHGKPPSELTAETAPAVSCTSSKSPTHVEKRQLSEPPVLVQKHSDKSTGTIKSLPKSRVVATAMLRIPSSKVASRLTPQTGNAIVSTKEQADTSKHAPSTKTALTLSKLSPVSSLRAIPSNRLMNEPKLSLSNVSKRLQNK
ncbi:hypothetical protein F5887DRAFT_920089 [Amanita rubescens]|nr:hypothetical protein F5887DRAFT_920089 [Amanita rubescens]